MNKPYQKPEVHRNVQVFYDGRIGKIPFTTTMLKEWMEAQWVRDWMDNRVKEMYDKGEEEI